MKKYTAPTLEAALAAIRAELGPDALIVHQSETKKGPLGLLSKPQVEVVAAVDDTRPAQRTAVPAQRQRAAFAPAPRPAAPPPRPAMAPRRAPAVARALPEGASSARDSKIELALRALVE